MLRCAYACDSNVQYFTCMQFYRKKAYRLYKPCHSACFYWSAGKFWTISHLLCSCKLVDDVSTDLFQLNEKAPMAHLPSKFGRNATSAPENNCGHPKCGRFTQYSATLVFIVKCHLKLVRCQPHQKVIDGRRPITSHRQQPNIFLLGRELVFCHCHWTSSGICRQSLLTRNTQIVCRMIIGWMSCSMLWHMVEATKLAPYRARFYFITNRTQGPARLVIHVFLMKSTGFQS